MVSTLNLDEKFNRVRKNFCFYLDIQDHGLARSLSRRIQDMGLQQEVCLTSRVTHVVRSRPAGAQWAPAGRERRTRADAMLERVPALPPTQAPPHARYIQLTVQKAISLLDKLYDTFFTASRKAHVTYFTKHFIKIEFLDKLCRPIYKEFDEWPEISIEPDPPKEKKKETPEKNTNTNLNTRDTIQKMTRKSRPRIKEREEKEAKGGYCEMCNSEYADAALHRRSPHHVAFVRDRANFLALDSLIGAGADVAAFLDRATPINGERRSLRNLCNGDAPTKRCTRSQSPDPALNGTLDHDRKHNARSSKRSSDTPVEDRQYCKVVGVSTKLRSSGSFAAKRKDSSPPCNGTKPLVVKFRKVRRSELSVLSDEAEQFMFPKRASSTSSTSSDDDDDNDDDDDRELSSRRKSTPPPPPQLTTERRRQARPLALKEESSEEDSWPEDKRRRKKRLPATAKRGRRVPCKAPPAEPPQDPVPEVIEQLKPAEITVPPPVVPEVSPLRDEPIEKCMKWEDGKLKYTPAVEQLEFAFECVPQSEPWFETFKRQDEDKVLTRNVPKYFALYSKSPKLPYECGQLPPLKPNCCPLSDLVKREDKPGPSRSYGTRGMKRQKIRKRTAVLQALEGHPRKSPREHASTLAILGSAGLLHRRKHADDTKSTASEDTISDTHSNVKIEPVISETQEASERLQQFLSEVFDDAGEFDVSDEVMDGEATVASSTNLPDMSSLMSECENCDLIRNEMKEAAADRPRGRRGKFKKKNRTGWPNKRKQKNSSRTNSVESEHKADSSLDRSSAEPPDDEMSQDTISEEDVTLSEMEKEEKTIIETSKTEEDSQDETLTGDTGEEQCEPTDSSETKETSLQELKVALIQEKAKAEEERKAKAEEERKAKAEEERNAKAEEERKAKAEEERKARSSETEDSKKKTTKRALAGLGNWLQPVVRVARVDPAAARCLRSAARPRLARRR